MKIYDISQELTGSSVYPGDPCPEIRRIVSVDRGDSYNMSVISMCAHNGTHVDAPYHFFNDGKTVEDLEIDKTVGMAYVAECGEAVTAKDANDILLKAKSALPESAKRILLKGKTVLSSEGARAFAAAGVCLVGNESQSVGPVDSPMEVHKILLGNEVVLLEGIRLFDVPEGVYLLCAAPISVKGGDGAPCRALLIEI